MLWCAPYSTDQSQLKHTDPNKEPSLPDLGCPLTLVSWLFWTSVLRVSALRAWQLPEFLQSKVPAFTSSQPPCVHHPLLILLSLLALSLTPAILSQRTLCPIAATDAGTTVSSQLLLLLLLLLTLVCLLFSVTNLSFCAYDKNKNRKRPSFSRSLLLDLILLYRG